MNKNLTFEGNINGTDFTFFASIEIKVAHATVNIEAINSNKQDFEKLPNNSNILKDLALKVLIVESNEKYKLTVNQIQSSSQWFGQFKRTT
jgi:hypothetical protein